MVEWNKQRRMKEAERNHKERDSRYHYGWMRHVKFGQQIQYYSASLHHKLLVLGYNNSNYSIKQ